MKKLRAAIWCTHRHARNIELPHYYCSQSTHAGENLHKQLRHKAGAFCFGCETRKDEICSVQWHINLWGYNSSENEDYACDVMNAKYVYIWMHEVINISSKL